MNGISHAMQFFDGFAWALQIPHVSGCLTMMILKGINNMKTMIAYFSAESGRTRQAAKLLAKTAGADLFEITPKVPYTKADLNYINPLSRVNKEFIGKKDVPVTGTIPDFESYDTVLIGFPIWYGCAPNVVNTFCRQYDFTGKKVAAFATSGGSGIGKTAEKLQPYVKGAAVLDARLFPDNDRNEMKAWLEKLQGSVAE